jgi:hypothetical protein
VTQTALDLEDNGRVAPTEPYPQGREVTTARRLEKFYLFPVGLAFSPWCMNILEIGIG